MNQQPAIIRFFEYKHLPEHLQAVSKPFCDLANAMVEHLPDTETEEVNAGLRFLLLAKDCFVRAGLTQDGR